MNADFSNHFGAYILFHLRSSALICGPFLFFCLCALAPLRETLPFSYEIFSVGRFSIIGTGVSSMMSTSISETFTL